ncbi:MAG: ATP-dependent RecD-like DNA helicase [Candidatus Fimadaptatus sp.]|jgi:exodeoxyribonuclease V alpha subunit
MGESVKLEATVEQITFRNESNGWTVMQLRKGRQRMTAVGAVLNVSEGERVSIEGEWTEHPDYGAQIKLSACDIVAPSSTSDIERYLASGTIKGIGPATARLIVQEFGKRTLEILDSEPERLHEVPGIGPKRAALIGESYREQMGARQALMFLHKNGFSTSMAARVYKLYGAATENIVRTNPYRLVRDVKGIGFATADRMAAAIGVPRESPFRIQSGIIHVLQEAAGASGHIYLPMPELMDAARRLLGVADELIDNALRELLLSREVIIEDVDGVQAVYSSSMHDAEADVAYRLSQLARAASPVDVGDVDARISRFERRNGITFSPEQRQAVTMAATRGMVVITGGPGTGKTTIIKCILSLMPSGSNVALCAPTGRAAKRMSEATGVEARTIHRLLEYGGEDEQNFGRNGDHPLDVQALICDETSMVDIMLMRSLLHAIVDGTRLVLVGDADQLPSVGPGCVLRDILASGAIPSVSLKEIHRQSGDSMIIVGAHRINSGDMPVLNAKGGDFFLERKSSAAQAAQSIVELATRRLPAFAHVDALGGIQVLAPAKKGDTGVWALNRLLQEAFNPRRSGVSERATGDTLLREGDKVMHIKNDYDLEWTLGAEQGEGVFNGDMGRITEIDTRERTVTVRFDDERVATYDDGNIDELELAYCISVHKSQGCEFPVVIMPVMPGPRMLMARNLLYTAVTRARNCMVLVGRDDVIAGMVANNYVSQRYSALSERLRKYAIALPDGEASRQRERDLAQMQLEMEFPDEQELPGDEE